MSQEERIRELEKRIAELEYKNPEQKPWTEVSRYIESNLLELEQLQVNPKMKWNIKDSITTLIRHSLGLRRVQKLHSDQIEIAKNIADRILDVYKTATV